MEEGEEVGQRTLQGHVGLSSVIACPAVISSQYFVYMHCIDTVFSIHSYHSLGNYEHRGGKGHQHRACLKKNISWLLPASLAHLELCT